MKIREDATSASTSRISVRLTQEEKDKLFNYCADMNISVSEFVRNAAFEKINQVFDKPTQASLYWQEF